MKSLTTLLTAWRLDRALAGLNSERYNGEPSDCSKRLALAFEVTLTASQRQKLLVNLEARAAKPTTA